MTPKKTIVVIKTVIRKGPAEEADKFSPPCVHVGGGPAWKMMMFLSQQQLERWGEPLPWGQASPQAGAFACWDMGQLLQVGSGSRVLS